MKNRPKKPRKPTIFQKLTHRTRAGAACALSGALVGLLMRLDHNYGSSGNYLLPTLLPGFLFGIAFVLANKKLYRYFWMTLVGFTLVSTFIYPMMVVMSARVFGISTLGQVIVRFPFFFGLLPSLIGASLLYLTYAAFINKNNWRFFQIYAVVAIVLGLFFFPLLNWIGHLALSFALWQGVIGYMLTYLHFVRGKN